MESRTSTMENLKMQRRHFQLIAEVLKDSRPEAFPESPVGLDAHVQWGRTVEGMAIALASTNPGFDRARFLKACGMED